MKIYILTSDKKGVFHLHGYGLATRVEPEKSGTITSSFWVC